VAATLHRRVWLHVAMARRFSDRGDPVNGVEG
jgi:hypothetical protein